MITQSVTMSSVNNLSHCHSGDDPGYIALDDVNFYASNTPVLLPASAWLMLSGLCGLGFMPRKRRGIAA